MDDFSSRLAELLGPPGWVIGAAAQSYERDWLDRYGVPPIGVARPSSTAEVSSIVKICSGAGVAIVAQGGNTSLCGGAVAESERAIILSLSRMSNIAAPDVESGTVLVEAGAILSTLHDNLAPHGVIFPMHLGAEGSARIGGLIATNAGGSHAFRYGVMESLVLGLEVVTADGTIWNGLRSVQKDNAGYQLRKLFCGSEGTLGVITRAVLKVFPAPRKRASALVALPDYRSAVTLAARVRREAGEFTSGLEFFSECGLALALKHIPALRYPLETRAAVYMLIELVTGSDLVPLDDILAQILEFGMDEGRIADGAIASSDSQRLSFWRLREEQPEGQRLEGAQLKFDISVPPGAVADFIAAAGQICQNTLPGVRINPFGHLGDGNIHYNLSPPAGSADFADAAATFGLPLSQLATDFGGSFAAEHGLGRSKVALADHVRGGVERALMKKLKRAFDPDWIMNPGVIIERQSQ